MLAAGRGSRDRDVEVPKTPLRVQGQRRFRMTSAGPSAVAVQGQQGSDFAELSRVIRQAGLLRCRYGYYILTSGLTIIAFAAWVVFGLVGNSWWQLFVAAFLALVCAHLSFIGHDAGHKKIFHGRHANDAVGLVHGGLVGLSYSWWVAKHNRHHANPNHEDDDPDLHIPALAFTLGQGGTKVGLTRWITKYQAFLFFPLLLLEGLNLHWASIQAVWRRDVNAGKVETALLLAHVGAYLTAVFLVLSPARRSCSSRCTSACGVSTWDARSPPTTRECPW
jgi:fatty acid desaturase